MITPKKAPKVFFACRLPQYTIDEIKERAKGCGVSEAIVVERAISPPIALAKMPKTNVAEIEAALKANNFPALRSDRQPFTRERQTRRTKHLNGLRGKGLV